MLRKVIQAYLEPSNVTVKILLIVLFLLTANHRDRINLYQHVFR